MPKAHDAAPALKELLDSENDEESAYQTLLEEKSELVPVDLDKLNHDVQWGCVISKFEITRDRIPDLTYITKSSDAWRLVFIELERPGRQLFLSRDHIDWHGDTRAPIAQIENWKEHTRKHPDAVREALRPLMHFNPDFEENPVEFRFVLITGRSASGRYSEAQAGAVHRLREERNIRLMTWDGLYRHAQRSRRWRLNVLAHHRSGFKFKLAHADTDLFADFLPDQIHLAKEQEGVFRDKGYQIDAWREGKRLSLNYKYPRESSDALFQRAIHPHRGADDD